MNLEGPHAVIAKRFDKLLDFQSSQQRSESKDNIQVQVKDDLTFALQKWPDQGKTNLQKSKQCVFFYVFEGQEQKIFSINPAVHLHQFLVETWKTELKNMQII